MSVCRSTLLRRVGKYCTIMHVQHKYYSVKYSWKENVKFISQKQHCLDVYQPFFLSVAASAFRDLIMYVDTFV
jgi:hypothetical protein